MRVEDYEYMENDDLEENETLTDERKEELIKKVKDQIVRNNIALFRILRIGKNGIEYNFLYNWLTQNKVGIRGTNGTLSGELDDYSYIKKLGIEKIDYLIGTHPHEDHIGGLDDVIKNFEIGTIYMPKVQTNTKTFEDVLDAITEKNLTVTTPKEGDKFELGKAECEIMLCGTGTKEEKENLNLSSIVTKVTYGKQSYLFMGDSEKENEQSRTWPKVNVLKVGHHGSNTSSSKEFLDQVLPQIAIISIGKDNSYGHPKQVILDRLNKIGAVIYTTKDKGNILIESDGNNNKVSFYILGNLS